MKHRVAKYLKLEGSHKDPRVQLFEMLINAFVEVDL